MGTSRPCSKFASLRTIVIANARVGKRKESRIATGCIVLFDLQGATRGHALTVRLTRAKGRNQAAGRHQFVSRKTIPANQFSSAQESLSAMIIFLMFGGRIVKLQVGQICAWQTNSSDTEQVRDRIVTVRSATSITQECTSLTPTGQVRGLERSVQLLSSGSCWLGELAHGGRAGAKHQQVILDFLWRHVPCCAA